jgi:hypothetical protein|tara:strand:+ start:294 stop:485 length:192 start_codon:yes stop_codon:yes gene_type:complete
MIIEVFIKNNFGSDHTYIVDPDIASSIQMLTSRKTLTDFDMQALRKLGHEFVLVKNPDLVLVA